jgi:hypothetical protein
VETARNSGREQIARTPEGTVDLQDCRNRTLVDFWNVQLGNTLDCMSLLNLIEPHRDIVVANVGLHHPNEDTLKDNTESFVNWLHSQKNETPYCAVWRQTLPQHFNTETGSWRGGLVHEAKAMLEQAKMSNDSCCAPISMKNFEAHSRFVQQHNAVSDPLLQVGRIPILQLWDAMTGLFKYHGDCGEKTVDCSHWQPPAVAFITKLMLHQLHESCTKS